MSHKVNKPLFILVSFIVCLVFALSCFGFYTSKADFASGGSYIPSYHTKYLTGLRQIVFNRMTPSVYCYGFDIPSSPRPKTLKDAYDNNLIYLQNRSFDVVNVDQGYTATDYCDFQFLTGTTEENFFNTYSFWLMRPYALNTNQSNTFYRSYISCRYSSGQISDCSSIDLLFNDFYLPWRWPGRGDAFLDEFSTGFTCIFQSPVDLDSATASSLRFNVKYSFDYIYNTDYVTLEQYDTFSKIPIEYSVDVPLQFNQQDNEFSGGYYYFGHYMSLAVWQSLVPIGQRQFFFGNALTDYLMQYISNLRVTITLSNEARSVLNTLFTDSDATSYIRLKDYVFEPYPTNFGSLTYLEDMMRFTDTPPTMDFTSWISSAVGGFMDFNIMPGVSISGIFLLCISISLTLLFLKFFAGG